MPVFTELPADLDTPLSGALSNPFVATRYRSLVVLRDTVPADLEVSASADDDEIMGRRHPTYPIEGVPFHPESILAVEGMRLLQNFLAGQPR